MQKPMSSLTVAITGASGAIYAIRLMECLVEKKIGFNLVSSSNGRKIIIQELGDRLGKVEDPQTLAESESEIFCRLIPNARDLIKYYHEEDMFSPIASGSSVPAQMVIVPLSMGTLGRIAAGISSNLIERSADVMLKERKKLVLVPREAPMNAIHLENLLKLARIGAHVVPAMPAFYQKPKTIDDLVDFVVGRILDALGIEHNLFKRW